MTEYRFRSRNTDRESKTRIGAAVSEYLDYFRGKYFDIPKYSYPILIVGAPSMVFGIYWSSLCSDEPIQRIRKIQI